MFTAGILEDMFSGIGIEYLILKENSNYSFGLNYLKLKKEIMIGVLDILIMKILL